MRESVPWAGSLGAAVGLCLLFVCASEATPAAPYVFPLRERMPLTSTFGEYRAGHFHGGLDFSTGGETGMDVFAVAEGYVSRIRVSGAGYGKALYIQLDDGRTAVYAHLQDFSPRIERLVEEIQRKRGRYSVHHFLDSDELRVRAGELIGHSGDSGSGPAHFHFEIREGERQVNPLLLGIEAADSRPPRIRSIVLTPLGPHSTVDGRHDRLAVGLRWNRSRSVYTTSRRPVIQGDVAVGCRLYDLADGKPNRLAPYGASLSVDGREYYEMSLESVSLSETQQVGLVYDFEYALRGGTNVLNLFCATGRSCGVSGDESDLRGVISVDGSGTVGAEGLGVGRHEIKIEAWDCGGNRRTARLELVADNRPVLNSIRYDEETNLLRTSASDPDGDRLSLIVESTLDSGVTWAEMCRKDSTGSVAGEFELERDSPSQIYKVRALDEWGAGSEPAYVGPGLERHAKEKPKVEVKLRDGFAEIMTVFPSFAGYSPEIWLVDSAAGAPVRSLRCERTGPAIFRTTIPLADSIGAEAVVTVIAHGESGSSAVVEPLMISRVQTGREGRVRLPGGAVLVTSAGTFLRDVHVRTSVEDSLDAEVLGELIPAGPPYRLDPQTQFFNGLSGLYLPYEGDAGNRGKMGLYRKGRDGRWRWIGARWDEEGRGIGGDISGFSVFALMADLTPPKVTRLRPGDGSRYRHARPKLEAKVRDAGSGVDWDSVQFTIDGEKLITGWEAETNYVWAKMPATLAPGPHRVLLFAADRAGNETAAEARFVVGR